MLFNLIRDGKQAIAELSKSDRFFHIFWLLGPFILLIERSPADAWLTILALGFVVRVIIKRETAWLQHFWVRAAFAFWGVCLLSAAMSNDPGYSLGEAAAWVRFPLFAMATAFWLGRDRRLLYLMLISTAIAVMVMCGILAAELIIEGQRDRRLRWPYDDLVPGSYLAKTGLPVAAIAVALVASVKGRLAIFATVFAVTVFVFTMLTGERVNTLIVIAGGILAGLVWKPNLLRIGAFLVGLICAFIGVLLIFPDSGARYISNFIEHLPTGAHSPYYRAMMPAWLAFEQAPWLGIGTGNFRNMCLDIIAARPILGQNLDCPPHPHNFYLQILGETGIIGFVFGSVFLGSLVWLCFKVGRAMHGNVVLATAWVIPFAFFWPIASSSDFFGQWNNIFIWSGVALAMGAVHSRQP